MKKDDSETVRVPSWNRLGWYVLGYGALALVLVFWALSVAGVWPVSVVSVLLLLYTVFIAVVIWFADIAGSVGDSSSAIVSQIGSMVGSCVCGVLAVVFAHWPTRVWYRRLRVWYRVVLAVMVVLFVVVAVVARGKRYVGDYIGLFVAPVFCVLGILKEASLVGLSNAVRLRNKRMKGGKHM